MRAIRLAAAAAVVVFALYAIWALIVPRYTCNIAIRNAEKNLDKLFQTQDEVVIAPLLRANEIALTDCERCTRDDHRLHMYLGWTYYRADRFAEAEKHFALGLKYERRPELLRSLGLAELQLGKSQLATDHLTEAAMFDPKVPDEIPYGEVRQNVLNRVQERERRFGRRP